MKKLTFLFLMCLASMGAMAKSVVFTLNDGTKVYYLLGGDTNPVLRFVDGKMVVDADAYELSQIKNFFISNEDDPNGIEEVLSKQNVQFRANTLVINSPKVKSVKVYTLGGVAVEADVTKLGDVISVNLNGLEKGAYIINVGKSSLKVMKK
ncbi:MAG: hypothetical protein IJ693_09805 [Bacteroidaceae bacterium]|nr:hypothetical protein [Bacteroidaceae bacterium]